MTKKQIPKYKSESKCMQTIERLDWTDGIAFVSHGVKIGVRTNNPKVLKRVESVLPLGWKPTGSPVVRFLFSLFIGIDGPPPNFRRHHLLYNGSQRLIRTLDQDILFGNLESALRLTVAEFTKRKVFIHAGVVAWNNQAIVIPGSSYSGKTTLVAELVKAGATYYSDEYAVLDNKGFVHPYPKTLSIRESNGGVQTEYRVEELGGRAGKKIIPIAMVAICDYKEGARWRPKPLSPGQGALEMLSHTVSARREPGLALSTLNRVALHASFLKGKRGEAKQAAENILQMLS